MLVKYSRLPGVGLDGEPLLHVIQPGELVKVANLIPEVEDFIGRLRPDPRYTYVLVNAMGYSEYYGSNSNKDWYGYNRHLDFNGLLHAPEDWGKDYENDRRVGRHWPYGYPTFYGATVYAHHQNRDPDKYGFGDMVFVAPNHKMKRIELVKRVDNDLIQKRGRGSILDRIRHGERVDVSMGCKVPFDLCSICTDWEAIQEAWDTFDPKQHLHPGIAILRAHKTGKKIRGLSITKADYCEHMKTMAGQILPDGQKVYVYNDFPRFFDNSFVLIGADKTARVMWFLPPDMPSALDSVAQRSPQIVIHDRTITVKQAMEKAAGAPIKLSEMEKQIPGGFARQVHLKSFTEPDIDTDILEQGSKVYGIKRLLSTLAALGIVLKPGEFQHIVLASQPMGDKLNEALEKRSAIFDTSVTKVADDFAVSGSEVDVHLGRAFAAYAPERSSFSPYLGPRCTMVGEDLVLPKFASVQTPVLDEIAAQYNGYRISILEQAPSVFPQYTSLVDLDPSDLVKVGSVGLGSLLLGLAPVVHLVSSHLKAERDAGKDLGTVGSFVADNPNFTRALTIGAGLRAAMGIAAHGGIEGLAAQAIGFLAGQMNQGSGLGRALGTMAQAM